MPGSFPVIHGTPGEGGAIREVLGLLEIPYVGSLSSACRVAFDKPVAKALVAVAGLATPASVTLPREAFHDLGASGVIDLIVRELGTSLFVKPSRGGSALGASAVRSASDLAAATAYFLEVSVAPWMTSTSTLPMAMRADGLDFAECCRTLLERAAARMA